MKKIERLNTILFSELEENSLKQLGTIKGGTYDKWTYTADKETRTGKEEDGSNDATERDKDMVSTDSKVDHDYLNNQQDLLVAVATNDTQIAL